MQLDIYASLICYILFTINDGQRTALDSQTLTLFWTQTARQTMPSPAFSVWQKDNLGSWGYRKNPTTVFRHYSMVVIGLIKLGLGLAVLVKGLVWLVMGLL